MHRFDRWIEVQYAAVAASLALASVALGLLARTYHTFPGDEAVNATVRHLGDGYEPVAYVFNELDGPIAATILALVGISLLAHRYFSALGIVATVVVLRPLLDIIKPLVDRPRPSGDFPIRELVSDSSFPSGHVMTATTAAALLILFAHQALPRQAVRPARGAAVALVLLTGTSRMWAGVHWFSDTWGALFWSLTLVTAVVALRPTFDAIERRARGPASASEQTRGR